MQYKLGVLGAGNMAEAIVRGVLGSGRLKADKIIAADVSPERRQLFSSELHVVVTDDNRAAAITSQTILLSVKPQQMSVALVGLGEFLTEQTLILSIAAGITTKKIEQSLGNGKKWRVVRAMPNTPMLVGSGMVGICAGAFSTPTDLATARGLFEAAAEVIEIGEDKIDAVTAISGSGPAYFFYLVEQMTRAGVELGLTQEQALLLSRQTALGSAKMLVQSKELPAELRRKVTSPGGTTHAAISHMEAQGLPKIISDAIKAAAKRSAELGA